MSHTNGCYCDWGYSGSNYYALDYTNQIQMYGFGTGKLLSEELKKASAGKYKYLLDLLGAKGVKNFGGMDLRSRLMLLLEVILADIDEQIFTTLKDLKSKADELKGITRSQGENNPGLISGLNTDSSILQAKLTMLVQRRQQLVDAINNALKNCHDAEMNAVRRMI